METKVDLMVGIQTWLIRNDFFDEEYRRSPSTLAKENINSFIKDQIQWVSYKYKQAIPEFCSYIEQHKCKGIEKTLQYYIQEQAKKYYKENDVEPPSKKKSKGRSL